MQFNENDTLNMLINEADVFVQHRKYFNSASKQSKIVEAINECTLREMPA